MTADDFSLVGRWLATPEVARWWGRDEDGGEGRAPFEEELADPNIALWIVSYKDQPFAFIQDYDPHAWPDHHFANLPEGARGMDQFIGEPEMIGRGLAQPSSVLMSISPSPRVRRPWEPIPTPPTHARSAPMRNPASLVTSRWTRNGGAYS